MMGRQLTFIDFFAGVGGFRLGLERVGMRCVGFCENDKFAVRSYRAMRHTKRRENGMEQTSQSSQRMQFQKQISGVREALVRTSLLQGDAPEYTVSEVDSF